VALVLEALANSNVVTSAGESTIRHIGGPPAIQAAAARLGQARGAATVTDAVLSSGVRLISKSPTLWAPPWQVVSAALTPPGSAHGPALKTATWTPTTMHATTASGDPQCWGYALHPGPIAISRSGSYEHRQFGLGMGANHAKIGVSVDAPWYTIFSDLNEDGPLRPTDERAGCKARQNGRGGMFFVVDNKTLHDDINVLITEPSAPAPPPRAGRRP
jgi:hypothetical protein